MTYEIKRMREQHGPIQEQHGPIGGGQNKHSFGNYDLVRRIDIGGMGEVYLARQRTAFGREVALKIIRSDLVHDVTARKRFLREAEVSAHLKHEHILPLVEFGEEQGRLFLVTPYIEGGTLLRRLQTGSLSLSEVHQLFSALVQAIAYIHKRGVIHRDLKPSNILLDTEEGTDQLYVRLIDFGIASLPGVVGMAPLTSADHEVGTIAYMAPERLNGITAPGNDIYSLGVILYQMLTGQLPNGGQAVTLPQALDAVVKRCIAPDPADRFTGADELLRAFESAYRAVRTATRTRLSVAPVTPDMTGTRPPVTPSSAMPALPISQNRSPVLPEPEEFDDDEPTPRRITAASPALARPATRITQENVVLSRSEMVLAPLPRPGSTFSRADYNAPTTSLDSAGLQARQVQRVEDTTTISEKPPVRPRQKRKPSPLAIIPLSIIVILLVIAGAIFWTAPIFVTAKIVVSPQVHAINKVFTMTAKPGISTVDANTQSIPANILTHDQTFSKTGPTTGRPIFCLFDCPKVVSTDDVYKLSVQVKQDAIAQLTQYANSQLQTKNALGLSKPTFTDINYKVNPLPGTTSDTVTVSLTERVSVEYAANSDAQNLAGQLLQRQVQRQPGQNYALINSLTQVGLPTVGAVDANGAATITIAAGSVAKYHISPSQVADMQNHIKGMKLKNAQAFLAQQPGLDAKTLHFTLSYGDTLPNDVHQMTITTVDPVNLPPVQIPTVPATASPTATPTG